MSILSFLVDFGVTNFRYLFYGFEASRDTEGVAILDISLHWVWNKMSPLLTNTNFTECQTLRDNLSRWLPLKMTSRGDRWSFIGHLGLLEQGFWKVLRKTTCCIRRFGDDSGFEYLLFFWCIGTVFLFGRDTRFEVKHMVVINHRDLDHLHQQTTDIQTEISEPKDS